MKPQAKKCKHCGQVDEPVHLPAQNPDAEKSLLGSLMLANSEIDVVTEIVSAEHFYAANNQIIYRAMKDLADGGVPFDPVTLAAHLQRTGKLTECGGIPYLQELFETDSFVTAHAMHYAEKVRDCWTSRNITYALVNGLAASRDVTQDHMTVADKVAADLLQILDRRGAKAKLQICDSLPDTLGTIEKRIKAGGDVSGLRTGFADLDRQTTGLQPTELIILAARPSMGKTALVGNIAYNMTAAGHPVLFISLEQSVSELNERLLSAVARVNSHEIRTGHLSDSEQKRLWDAAEKIARLPLFVDDRPGQTLAQIRATARRLHRKEKLACVIVDYLQLITADDRGMPREQQVASFSRGMKFLAKDLNIPVIALAQLNRGTENREDKRPRLSDLRESGAIEQDADLVSFLHRPDAYDAETLPGEAEIVVAKHRSGPTGIVRLTWRKEFMQFANYAAHADIDYSTPDTGRL